MDTQPAKTAALATWKWLLLPLMAAVIVMTYGWLGPAQGFQDPESARIMDWDVPQAMLSVIWFGAAARDAVRYLLKSQAFDDTRSAKAAEVGLILTVPTVVTGAVFSKMQWGGGFNSPWYFGYWQWDPKQTCALIAVLFYGAYFGLRMSVEDPRSRARLSAVYAALGVVVVLFLYYIVPQIMAHDTLHPNAPVFKTGGLSPSYRTTYWLSTLGFLGITVWSYQLQLRLAVLAERRLERAEPRRTARTEAVRRPRADRADEADDPDLALTGGDGAPSPRGA